MGRGQLLPPPGVELAYAESAAGFSTTSTTPVDVTGVTITFTARVRPVMVLAGDGWTKNNTALANTTVAIYRVDTAANVAVGLITSATANAAQAWTLRRRLVLTAGTEYTFKLQANASAGTSVLNNISQGATWIQAIEV